MKKRSLIIGSEVYGLSGVHNDIDAISANLKQRGFENDVRVQANATRDGILGGYERLIRDTISEDIAVIYYSGHGGRVVNPNYVPAGGVSKYLQFIVPTDFSDDDFRGITSLELSFLLFKLTEKTKNIVIILDCCHSARMSRSLREATPRSLPRICSKDIGEKLTEFENQKLPESLYFESNPHALRLVATEADKSAYEYVNDQGKKVGILTESLLLALEEVGNLPATWQAVSMRVRERVMSFFPEQRPEIEGPSQRFLFATEESPRTGAVVFFYDNYKPSLRAGKILGAEIGSVYGMMPAAASTYEEEWAIARGTITEIEGAVSRIDLEFLSDSKDLVEGLLAYPLEVPFKKRAIYILDNSKDTDILTSSIVASKFLKLVEEESDSDFIVAIDEKGCCLLTCDNLALAYPEKATTEGYQLLLSRLERWARAESLRELEDGGLNAEFSFDWGRVIDNEMLSMSSGDTFHVEDRLYILFENKSETDLYIAIYDVGASGKVTLITASEPTGIKVTPGNSYLLGERGGKLVGIPAGWPKDLPNDQPGYESLIAVVSDIRQDFSALETDRIRAAKGRSSTQLEQMLSQFRTGGMRDFLPEKSHAGGTYAVERIDFELNSLPRPSSERKSVFVVDEALDAANIKVISPRSFVAPPQNIAIQLQELIVHKNRSLWNTQIRIDTLTLTGRTQGEDPYMPRTHKFGGISNEDRLPFKGLLVYHGPASKYVDFGIWVSKDTEDSESLSELLKEVANSDEFKGAATVLAGLALTGPQAAPTVAAVGAASTILYFTDHVISQAVSKSIGIYRTSFLAHERFGIGRHPTRGVIRAQDFSFSYTVQAV